MLAPVVIDSSVLAPVVNNMYIMDELLAALVWSVKQILHFLFYISVMFVVTIVISTSY